MSVHDNHLKWPVLWHAVGAAMLLAITVLSLSPSDAPYLVFLWWDKLMHFVGYAIIAAWYAALVPRAHLLWVLIGLIALGVGIEFGQGFVAGRSREALDALANTLGAISGVALGLTPWRHLLRLVESILTTRGRV